MADHTVTIQKAGNKPITFREGGLHRALGVPEDKPIPAGKRAAALAGKFGPKVKKMANFAFKGALAAGRETAQKKVGGGAIGDKLLRNVPLAVGGAVGLRKPELADLNKDNKISSFERARAKAIDKSQAQKKKHGGPIMPVGERKKKNKGFFINKRTRELLKS